MTYNSLISLCSRTRSPDFRRAEMVLAEMQAVGVPPSNITVTALMQVGGGFGSWGRGEGGSTRAGGTARGTRAHLAHELRHSQVYGRADVVRRGRDKLAELQKSGIAVEASMWRPLLHRMASRGDVPATDEIIDEIKRKTGKVGWGWGEGRLGHRGSGGLHGGGERACVAGCARRLFVGAAAYRGRGFVT